jgi:cell division protein FtsI (penicillin-binding protein 3)
MARKKRLTEPMVHAMQVRRLFFFAGCVIAAFLMLGYRLVDLQVIQHERFVAAARDNTERTFLREPKRGDLRDVRGNLLATSKIVHTICGGPDVIGTNFQTVARALSPILQMPEPELADRLRPRTRVNEKGQIVPVRWVWLKKKVEREDWLRVQEAMKQLTFGVDESRLRPTDRAAYDRIRRYGIFEESEEVRFYPNQTLAAHVLGYVGVNEETNAEGRVRVSLTGKDGLEKSLNKVLTGIRGWVQTETDSRKREIVLFREQDVASRPGLNAVLTIDSGIQHIVEDELALAMEKHTPVSISSVVVRPRTGEILAMANLPTFNPNQPGDAEPQQRRNRVITDQAEPGSTFKIVVVAAGINEGRYSLQDIVDCENGTFYFAGRPLGDTHPFGLLTVSEIISKSSNIGAAKIAINLGKESLYRYIRAFGFGQQTGIPLEGEIDGTVHPVARWSGLSISRIPMGHEIDCTPLQMVMAMCAIANDGMLMRPRLVDSLVDERGNAVTEFQPQPVRQVVSEAAAKQVVTALKGTVATNGTGFRAKMQCYTVAGKTGTAQKIVDGRYVRNKHYSSFIGFFPADNPELCISVVLDDPKKGYYGSETAAPIFKQIAERAAKYLAIPPENFPDQTLAVSVVPLAQSSR